MNNIDNYQNILDNLFKNLLDDSRFFEIEINQAVIILKEYQIKQYKKQLQKKLNLKYEILNMISQKTNTQINYSNKIIYRNQNEEQNLNQIDFNWQNVQKIQDHSKINSVKNLENLLSDLKNLQITDYKSLVNKYPVFFQIQRKNFLVIQYKQIYVKLSLKNNPQNFAIQFIYMIIKYYQQYQDLPRDRINSYCIRNIKIEDNISNKSFHQKLNKLNIIPINIMNELQFMKKHNMIGILKLPSIQFNLTFRFQKIEPAILSIKQINSSKNKFQSQNEKTILAFKNNSWFFDLSSQKNYLQSLFVCDKNTLKLYESLSEAITNFEIRKFKE